MHWPLPLHLKHALPSGIRPLPAQTLHLPEAGADIANLRKEPNQGFCSAALIILPISTRPASKSRPAVRVLPGLHVRRPGGASIKAFFKGSGQSRPGRPARPRHAIHAQPAAASQRAPRRRRPTPARAPGAVPPHLRGVDVEAPDRPVAGAAALPDWRTRPSAAATAAGSVNDAVNPVSIAASTSRSAPPGPRARSQTTTSSRAFTVPRIMRGASSGTPPARRPAPARRRLTDDGREAA